MIQPQSLVALDRLLLKLISINLHSPSTFSKGAKDRHLFMKSDTLWVPIEGSGYCLGSVSISHLEGVFNVNEKEQG